MNFTTNMDFTFDKMVQQKGQKTLFKNYSPPAVVEHDKLTYSCPFCNYVWDSDNEAQDCADHCFEDIIEGIRWPPHVPEDDLVTILENHCEHCESSETCPGYCPAVLEAMARAS